MGYPITAVRQCTELSCTLPRTKAADEHPVPDKRTVGTNRCNDGATLKTNPANQKRPSPSRVFGSAPR